MYKEEELQALQAQVKKRTVIVSVYGAVLLAGIIVSLVVRIQWLTDVLSLLLAFGLIFGIEMFIRPILAYRKHVNNILHGRTHEVEGIFVSMEKEESIVEGVHYHAFAMTDPNAGEPGDRLFYFDCEKPFPDVKAGDRIRVMYHDRTVGDLTVLNV